MYAFNELIQIFYENGLTGVFLFGLVIYLSIHTNNKNDFISFIKYGIIILVISAFFSFTLHSTPIILLLSLFLAVTANESDCKVSLSSFKSCVLYIVGLFFIFQITYHLIIQSFSLRKWSDMANEFFYSNEIRPNADLYNSLKSNPSFLMWYGQSLVLTKDYSGINILNEAKNKVHRYELYLNLGNAYELTGKYFDALINYQTAAFMMPNRFEPLYHIFLCNKAMGNLMLAKECATKLLEKEVKIQSEIINKIKTEAFVFINSYDKN
jgi:O-antigen polymerase